MRYTENQLKNWIRARQQKFSTFAKLETDDCDTYGSTEKAKRVRITEKGRTRHVLVQEIVTYEVTYVP